MAEATIILPKEIYKILEEKGLVDKKCFVTDRKEAANTLYAPIEYPEHGLFLPLDI